MKCNVLTPIKHGGKIITSGEVELSYDAAKALIAIGAVEAIKASAAAKAGTTDDAPANPVIADTTVAPQGAAPAPVPAKKPAKKAAGA